MSIGRRSEASATRARAVGVLGRGALAACLIACGSHDDQLVDAPAVDGSGADRELDARDEPGEAGAIADRSNGVDARDAAEGGGEPAADGPVADAAEEHARDEGTDSALGLDADGAGRPADAAPSDDVSNLDVGAGGDDGVDTGADADAGAPVADAAGDGIVTDGVDAIVTEGVDATVADGADASTDAVSEASQDATPPTDVTPGSGTSEATAFAIDPAHDNAQPNDAVASPLWPAWTATFGGPVSYPLVARGLAIVAAEEAQPNVRALDLATGRLVWGPVATGRDVKTAYEGGTVFALDGIGDLTALDVRTGAQIWITQLPGNTDFAAPPVAAGGFVYVNGQEADGTTYAVDEQTGIVAWTAGTFDGSNGAVAVAGGFVYEAEVCDQLSAFDARTGQRAWYHPGDCAGAGGEAPSVYEGSIWERDWALGDVIIDGTGKTAGAFTSAVVPAFWAGAAYYVNAGTLSAVDVQSKTVLWTFRGDGRLCTSPVVAGLRGQVFVGSASGNVYEIDATTGAPRSVHFAGAPVTAASEKDAIAIGAGHLLVPIDQALVVY